MDKDIQTYYTVYDTNQLNADIENYSKNLERTKSIDWVEFRRIMHNDIALNTDAVVTGMINGIPLNDLSDYFDDPITHWESLLELSEHLMKVSSFYYRMVNYFANMPLFNWWVDIYDVNPEKLTSETSQRTLKNTYSKVASKLESMNIKHEFGKIMKILSYQDIFCGLIIENDDNFFITHLDYRICKLTKMNDGLYTFAIDLSRIDGRNINAYPLDVQKAYVSWNRKIKNGKPYEDYRFYEPPLDKQICIKLNQQWITPYPILLGVIGDVVDLDTYKKLKLQSARVDNYKAIMVNVPIANDNSINKPLVTPEFLALFGQLNRENMSSDIGILYTLGGKGEAVSFKDSSNTRNNVSDAVDEMYDNSGISKEMFNGSSSATAVKLSVETDSAMIYPLYRQFERWVNRFLRIRKYNKPNYKFAFAILDATIYNRDDVTARYKDAVTLGATVIDKWLCSMGMTPSKMLGSFTAHDVIFDFHSHFEPLKSAYNSSDDEAKTGRPTNESKGEPLSDEGERTQDNNLNEDR